MMIHLTMTGYHAGLPLCNIDKPNVDKAEAKANGDTFLHAMYAPIDKLTDLCPLCKAEWDLAASNDDDN